jgi:hypothetical protein
MGENPHIYKRIGIISCALPDREFFKTNRPQHAIHILHANGKLPTGNSHATAAINPQKYALKHDEGKHSVIAVRFTRDLGTRAARRAAVH